MQIREFNEEVLYADEKIVKVGIEDIEALKEKALANKRKRVRLCSHRDVTDPVHEMLIIHTKEAYVRPHKHLNKSESFHVIEGEADVVLFDEEGKVKDVISMGDYSSGRKFYYRISAPVYHTLVIKTEFLVFHEATKGPFIKTDTIFAPWAPDEKDIEDCQEYRRMLSDIVSCKSVEGG